MEIPKKKLLEMYRNLLTARLLNEKLVAIYHAGGSGMHYMHRGEGEEAIAIAVCANLRKDDYLLLRTRVTPCVFAKGLSLRDVIASDEFKTVTGPVKFTGPENLKTPSMWLQWQKGELEVVWPPDMATAKLLFPKPNWP